MLCDWHNRLIYARIGVADFSAVSQDVGGVALSGGFYWLCGLLTAHRRAQVQGKASTMPETRYAILVGNRYYPFAEHLADLPASEQDVESLAAVLSDPHLGRFDEVQQLKNTSHSDILEEILVLLYKAQKDDLVLLYFSGHGKADSQGKLYLAVMNTQLDLLGATAIALEQLKDLLDNCRSTRIVIILDCHFSSVTGKAVEQETVENHLRLISSGRSKYIMAAPVAEHMAQEKESATQSVLTKHLIAGIKTGYADIDGNGCITTDQLYQYVHTKVLEETNQEPLKWDLSSKGDLVIAWPPERQAAGAAGSSMASRAHYDTITQMFKKGEVIPFLGPALLMPGAEAQPPVYEDLAQRLARSVGFAEEAEPLTLVSQKIHIVAGRGVVYDNLRDIYQPEPYVYSPALTHRFLARLQHPLLILSTAYDTLLEAAFDSVGKKYVVVAHILHADRDADRGMVVVQYSTQKGKATKCLAEELVLDLSQWSVIYKIHGTFG
ncbi:MAG TPA: caspase family protein, partial [Candidatus Tectomicrobia bacterium]